MLATVIASLAITSSANAQVSSSGCHGGTPPSPVSEPAAAVVALTALGLFVAARRRKSV